MLRHLLVVITLVSCSSGEGDKSDPSKASKQAPPTGDVATLFTGATVTLPLDVAKAAFGAGKADTLKAIAADSTYVTSKTVAKVSYDLDFDKAGKLTQIKLASGTELEPVLTKQWGPPFKTAKGEPFWFASDDSGLRAWLPAHAKGKAVTFSPYEPIPKLLGDKGFQLAFAAGKPLFGATLDELHAAWGTALCDFEREAPKIKDAFAKNAADSLYRLDVYQLKLRLCPKLPRTTEQYTPAGDTIRIGFDGKVLALVMSIPTGGSAELQQQILEQLDAKFGKAIELKTEKHQVRSYFDPAAKLRAIVSVHEQSVGLEVGPYLPVAELLGGDRPGLSIEAPSMPGGTFEQIEKDDPTHFRRMGTLASLIYPPTEYGQGNTEVGLDFYDKHKETYGYHVVLHHTDREAAGDEVFALLGAKFGEPKKDAKSKEGDLYFNFAKNGRKLSARRVSQQWQLRFTK
jgi:hypothetical protein